MAKQSMEFPLSRRVSVKLVFEVDWNAHETDELTQTDLRKLVERIESIIDCYPKELEKKKKKAGEATYGELTAR